MMFLVHTVNKINLQSTPGSDLFFFQFHLVSMAPNVKCVQPGGVTTREM